MARHDTYSRGAVLALVITPLCAAILLLSVRSEVLLMGSSGDTAIALLIGVMAGVAAISAALALIGYSETSDRRVLLMAAAYVILASLFAVFVSAVVEEPSVEALSAFARSVFAAVMLVAVSVSAGRRRPVPSRQMVLVTLLMVGGGLLIASFAAAYPHATADAFNAVPGGLKIGGNGAALVFSALAALATWQVYLRKRVPVLQHVAIGMTMMAEAGIVLMINPTEQTTLWWLGYGIVAAAGVAMGGGLLRMYIAARPPSSIYDLEVMPVVVDAAVSSGDTVFLLDTDGRISSTSANALAAALGEELVGKRLVELPEGEAWVDIWKSGQPDQIEVGDGEARTILQVTPTSLATPSDGSVLLVRDISDERHQRQHAELLSAELERSQAALDLRAQSLEQIYADVLHGLSAVVAAAASRDQYHAAHHRQLAQLAERVAARVGMTGAGLRQVREASMLYDIGKVSVPERVLNMNDNLTPEEWKQLQEVPIVGEKILRQVAFLRGASKVVRHVHERFDGQGYPDGLSGEAIPMGSRVVAVCASFLAMTNDRPYRQAITVDTALAEIGASSGKQLCPQAAKALADVLHSHATTNGKSPEQPSLYSV